MLWFSLNELLLFECQSVSRPQSIKPGALREMTVGDLDNLQTRSSALLPNAMDDNRKRQAAYLENSEVPLRMFSKSSESR
jgi:hypothetical protein